MKIPYGNFAKISLACGAIACAITICTTVSSHFNEYTGNSFHSNWLKVKDIKSVSVNIKDSNRDVINLPVESKEVESLVHDLNFGLLFSNMIGDKAMWSQYEPKESDENISIILKNGTEMKIFKNEEGSLSYKGEAFYRNGNWVINSGTINSLFQHSLN